MKVNDVPEHIRGKIPEDHIVYSFDVSEDGRLAVVAACGEDTDFPKVWIYDVAKDGLTSLGDTTLMDFPLSKAFFSDEGADVVAVPVSWTPCEPMLLEVCPDSHELLGVAPYDSGCAHFIRKNEQVRGMD